MKIYKNIHIHFIAFYGMTEEGRHMWKRKKRKIIDNSFMPYLIFHEMVLRTKDFTSVKKKIKHKKARIGNGKREEKFSHNIALNLFL